jgi:tetratricopeptide (TPR) repeat protein
MTRFFVEKDLAPLQEFRERLLRGNYPDNSDLLEIYEEQDVISELLLNHIWGMGEGEKDEIGVTKHYLDKLGKPETEYQQMTYYYLELVLQIFGDKEVDYSTFNQAIALFNSHQPDEYTQFPYGTLLSALTSFGIFHDAIDLVAVEQLMDTYYQSSVSGLGFQPYMEDLFSQNLAETYLIFGDIENARKFLDKSDAFRQEYSVETVMVQSNLYFTKGRFNLEIGDLEAAEQNLLLASEITDSGFMEKQIAIQLLLLYYINDVTKLGHYVHQLQADPKTDVSLMDLARALLLITQGRRKTKAKAEDICNALIENRNLLSDIRQVATTLMIYLLIEEYETEETDLILDELHNYLDLLDEFYSSEKITRKSITSTILRSKIMLIQQEVEPVLAMLEDLSDRVEQSNYSRLLPMVSHEISATEKIVAEWSKLGRLDVNTQRKIEDAKLKNYIKEALKFAT